ncbi:methyltransferase domain-containing protein [Pandoraea sp. PE-S2R-1]|uniref:methyltransferase domain-containing protein n=1 Tax=Pandoraea sp. PE-S2R-1 TaxID=1986994 RepID=UPI000B4062A1|nr:methyltransferase domain-containing protein [Pandoraea sp. PE-S2R-1]
MNPISVKVIVQGPKGVLFLRNPRNELELPGGRPDYGEALEVALIREMEEECGLHMSDPKYAGSKSCEVIPGKHVLLVFFYCQYNGQPVVLSNEHTAYQWVDINADRPETLPDFYWSFCKSVDCIASETASSTSYPLLTGELDRRRLQITSEIYDPVTIEFLRKYVPSTGRILDVGCGHGQIAQWIAKTSPLSTVLGLDVSANQIALATSAATGSGLQNLTFQVGDVRRLENTLPPNAYFDLITCRFTLLHTDKRAEIIQSLVAFLCPGGTLAIEEPSLTSLFCVPHLQVFEDANAAIVALGKKNGIDYDCIEDIWSIASGLDVDIREASFSQPTIWAKEHKALVYLSFEQFKTELVKQDLLDAGRAEVISRSLRHEYMDDRVISCGLRTLHLALSATGKSR